MTDAILDTLDEAEIVALTAWGEARNQPILGIVGVLSVIRNRYLNGHWGATFKAVCLAHLQFSCWNEGDPNRAQMLAFAQILNAGQPMPYDPPLLVCQLLANELVAGRIRSNVGDAMFYFAPASTPTPTWALPPAKRVALIGSHVFYTDVRL